MSARYTASGRPKGRLVPKGQSASVKEPSAVKTIERLRGDTPRHERHRLTRRSLEQVYKRARNDREGDVVRCARSRASAVCKLVDDVLDAEPPVKGRKPRKHTVSRAEYVACQYARQREVAGREHAGASGALTFEQLSSRARGWVIGKAIGDVLDAAERPYDDDEQRKANKRGGRAKRKDWTAPMTDWERATQEQVRLLRESNELAKESEGELSGALRVAARYSVPQLLADFDLDPDLEPAMERWLMVQFGEALTYAPVDKHRVVVEFDTPGQQDQFFACVQAVGLRAAAPLGFLQWLEDSAKPEQPPTQAVAAVDEYLLLTGLAKLAAARLGADEQQVTGRLQDAIA